MKQQTRRARRMDRNHKLNKRVGLNLTSLMDIFTILVFFLLITSSSAPQLPNSKDIKLPTSVAEKVPEETLVIAVTDKDILVQGRRVASVVEVMQSEDILIVGLKDELLFRAKNSARVSDDTEEMGGRTATIMGDEKLSPRQLYENRICCNANIEVRKLGRLCLKSH